MPEILSIVAPEHRIAAGMDSTVYWPKGSTHVYKVFPPHYTAEMLETYVSFVDKLVEEGVAFLGMLYDDHGQAYRIEVSANRQEQYGTSLNGEKVLKTPFIEGPTIYSIMMSFEGGRYHQDCLAQIDSMTDKAESARLRKLHNRFCTKAGRQLFYGLSDYTLPGEMNVKVRMPADDEIHFIVTDLFGDYRKHYNLASQEVAEA